MPHEVPPLGAAAQGDVADAMALALAAAERAGEAGEVPVGAAVTDAAGGVLAVAGNAMRAEGDASAHAEMRALRAAAAARGTQRLEGCTLWVTLEPCPMCAAAAGLFRVSRLVFAAYDPKGGGVEHGPRVFQTARALWVPEVVGGVREQEAAARLREFFAEIRKKDVLS